MKKRRIIFWLVGLLFCCCSCAVPAEKDLLPLSSESDTAQQESQKTGQLLIPALKPEDVNPESSDESEIPVSEEPAADPLEDRVQSLLSEMTLEEQVGQLLFVGCPSSGALEVLNRYSLGGYIFFSSHFKDQTADEVRKMTDELQSSSKIPLLLGVDEEGGTVVRVSAHPSLRAERFASPRDLLASGGMDAVEADTREKAQLLLSLGINVNLAPVCDLSDDPNDFIYARCFGSDPEQVSTYISHVVDLMREEGIGCVLKHFPGYGSCGDTHTGVIVDTRSSAEILESAILPFQAGVEHGAGAVMVCHMIMEAFDAELPASLSPEVHDLLREMLGEDIVVMTDDLDMGGITDYMDGASAAVQAVLAGNDLLLTSDYETHYHAVLDAVKDGTIPESRIAESVCRILRWKIKLGLMD